jgi:hypothetical protein
MLGLSKEELEQLFSFGETPEERSNNLFGAPDEPWENMVGNILNAMRAKIIDVIQANNKRLAEQLNAAGIKLP